MRIIEDKTSIPILIGLLAALVGPNLYRAGAPFFASLIVYLAIVAVSIFLPVYIFKRTRMLKEVTAILSMILFIGLFNFWLWLGLDPVSLRQLPPLNEAHGVLWLIVPIAVYIVCWHSEKKSKKV